MDSVVVVPPRLTFKPGIGQAQEPVGIETLRPALAFNDSANALSVGAPGRLKSNTTSCW